MNLFRFLGDMSHILSFMILLHKIVKGKSAAGISLRTQELYAIVFCSRYIDLFWNFSSMYNWLLKVCSLLTSLTHLPALTSLICAAHLATLSFPAVPAVPLSDRTSAHASHSSLPRVGRSSSSAAPVPSSILSDSARRRKPPITPT